MTASTSIGNNPRDGAKPTDPPPDDKATLMPGAEVLPGSVVTDGDTCLCCGGSGKMRDGSECRECRGSGKASAAADHV